VLEVPVPDGVEGFHPGVARCGTPLGHRRHLARGERPCFECRAANRAQQRLAEERNRAAEGERAREPWPCREDPDLWFSTQPADRGMAVHICDNHCPVLVRCREWARADPPEAAVQGGVVWTRQGRPDRRGASRVGRCDRCWPVPVSS
jgi:hypothetical protein